MDATEGEGSRIIPADPYPTDGRDGFRRDVVAEREVEDWDKPIGADADLQYLHEA